MDDDDNDDDEEEEEPAGDGSCNEGVGGGGRNTAEDAGEAGEYSAEEGKRCDSVGEECCNDIGLFGDF